jgi:hypothetical protein
MTADEKKRQREAANKVKAEKKAAAAAKKQGLAIDTGDTPAAIEKKEKSDKKPSQ